MALLTAALLAWAAGCGGRHSTPGDGDADGPDAVADGDGDADSDGDVDAEEDDEGDADDGGWDADEPDDTTWVVQHSPSIRSWRIQSIEPHPDGGFVVAGSLDSEWWVARIDPWARVVWSRYLGGSGVVAYLAVGPDGTVVVTVGPWIAGLDSDGSLLWQRTVEPSPLLVAVLDDGTFLIWNVFDVMRWSPGGGAVWSVHLDYDTEPRGDGRALEVWDDGMVYLAAGTALTAMDLDGGLLWARAWEWTYGPDRITSAATTSDGGVVLAGYQWGLWAGKVDREGTLEWAFSAGNHDGGHYGMECYPRCDMEEALGVAVGPDDEVLLAGFSTTTNEATGRGPLSDLLLLWTDRDGVITRVLAGDDPTSTEQAEATAAAYLPSGRWVVAGRLERSILASLDAEVGGDDGCGLLREAMLEPNPLEYRLWATDVRATEGAFEVSDADRLVSEDRPLPLETLCR